MAKPQRSPVLGYNHNIRYHGRVFHVQSEDSGPLYPRVYTHLFHAGTILVTKKQDYEPTTPEDTVKLLMQQQHKLVMRELTRSAYDDRIAAFFAARGEPAVLADQPGTAPAIAEVPPSAPVPAGTPAAPSAPIVVMGSGMYPAPPAAGVRAPAVSSTPPGAPRANATPRPSVVPRAPDLRRSPVVMSSSADGVVVQRNIVIGVGTPAPTAAPAARGRSAVPYPPRTAAQGGTPRPQVDSASAPRAATGNTPRPSPPSPSSPLSATGKTPSPERSQRSDLILDKSLDEVILEYLSDETED